MAKKDITIANMTFHISETKRRIAYEKRHLKSLKKYLADVGKK
tara:strand:+ start:570 stop:698 length:129 start_codon:yes stop_codon:yes gene_type:complete